jgi:hypothetical protein
LFTDQHRLREAWTGKLEANLKSVVWLRLICVVLLLTIGALLYAGWVQNAVQKTLPGKSQPLFAYGQSLDQGLSVLVDVTAVVPERSRLELRLELSGLGNLVDEQERLIEPLELVINGLSGRQSYYFRAGQGLSTIQAAVPLRGTAFYYPRDLYRGLLELQAFSATRQPIALKVVGRADLTGFRISKGELKQISGKRLKEYEPASPHQVTILLEACRSPLVQAFANFILGLQWTVASAVVSVFVSIWLLHRKLETSTFVWVTTTLFALPSLRNTMVDAPHIGIYIDFFGFLCCEGAVALVLVGLVTIWLGRGKSLA